MIALGIAAGLLFGLLYFVQDVWPRVPPAVTLMLLILLAVAVIGYPIYALAQWSNRYLARLKKTGANPDETRRKK
ncbi:MAG: hypothetical protein ACREX9_22400 [Gammaproteobacteria bacterium]